MFFCKCVFVSRTFFNAVTPHPRQATKTKKELFYGPKTDLITLRSEVLFPAIAKKAKLSSCVLSLYAKFGYINPLFFWTNFLLTYSQGINTDLKKKMKCKFRNEEIRHTYGLYQGLYFMIQPGWVIIFHFQCVSVWFYSGKECCVFYCLQTFLVSRMVWVRFLW